MTSMQSGGPASSDQPVQDGLWHRVCPAEELTAGWGEAALIGGHEYALFRTPQDRIFATDHRDPRSGSLVMARGIMGSHDGVPTIASPLYKEVYRLDTGECISGAPYELPVHPVRIQDGALWLQA